MGKEPHVAGYGKVKPDLIRLANRNEKALRQLRAAGGLRLIKGFRRNRTGIAVSAPDSAA